MIIFPAIDIKEGKVVRLLQGQFDKITEYSLDPVEIANKWKELGTEWIHIVDLDGAKIGKIQNKDIIADIIKKVNVKVEMGGGVRTKEDIEALLSVGVERIILGTQAIEDIKFLSDVIKEFDNKIAVSLDCRDGFLMKKGWVEKTEIKATYIVKQLEDIGLKCLIYTDIGRDGMLTGPNIDALNNLLDNTSIPVIASGGVSCEDDVCNLKELEGKGVFGVIIGKALYEGKVRLDKVL